MSYLVLARKWRPLGFADMAGQGHVARVLANAIRSGRVAHCYLFTGVRGVGKTSAARILAKALNCEKGPTPEPCNECVACVEIGEGRAIDVYEIDGASNRGIDEVRQIIENVRYQPARSRYKVYIIDEVHQVTRDAFNALLKTLEEPPPFVKFILATTECHRVPDTILSRCQRFDFRRIPVREIHQRLRTISDAEGLSITDEALLLLSRESQGSMRDAQSLLEQVLAFAVPEEGRDAATSVDEELLLDILGVAERQVLHDVSAAVLGGRPADCLDIVGDVASRSVDLVRLAHELVEHFRNLLVIRLLQDSRSKAPGYLDAQASNRLLDLTDSEVEELTAQVSMVSVESLMQYYRLMAQGDELVARSPYPRFDLEMTLVRLAALSPTIPVAEALERLERLERECGEKTGSRDETNSKRRALAVPATPDPGRNSVPVSVPDEAVRWKEFLEFIGQEKKFLASYLEQAEPLIVSSEQLTIAFRDRAHRLYFEDRENQDTLRSFAQRFFAPAVVVRVVPAAEAGSEATGGNGPSRRGTNRGEDIIDEAVRLFGGSVRGLPEIDDG